MNIELKTRELLYGSKKSGIERYFIQAKNGKPVTFEERPKARLDLADQYNSQTKHWSKLLGIVAEMDDDVINKAEEILNIADEGEKIELDRVVKEGMTKELGLLCRSSGVVDENHRYVMWTWKARELYPDIITDEYRVTKATLARMSPSWTIDMVKGELERWPATKDARTLNRNLSASDNNARIPLITYGPSASEMLLGTKDWSFNIPGGTVEWLIGLSTINNFETQVWIAVAALYMCRCLSTSSSSESWKQGLKSNSLALLSSRLKASCPGWKPPPTRSYVENDFIIISEGTLFPDEDNTLPFIEKRTEVASLTNLARTTADPYRFGLCVNFAIDSVAYLECSQMIETDLNINFMEVKNEIFTKCWNKGPSVGKKLEDSWGLLTRFSKGVQVPIIFTRGVNYSPIDRTWQQPEIEDYLNIKSKVIKTTINSSPGLVKITKPIGVELSYAIFGSERTIQDNLIELEEYSPTARAMFESITTGTKTTCSKVFGSLIERMQIVGFRGGNMMEVTHSMPIVKLQPELDTHEKSTAINDIRGVYRQIMDKVSATEFSLTDLGRDALIKLSTAKSSGTAASRIHIPIRALESVGLGKKEREVKATQNHSHDKDVIKLKIELLNFIIVNSGTPITVLPLDTVYLVDNNYIVPSSFRKNVKIISDNGTTIRGPKRYSPEQIISSNESCILICQEPIKTLDEITLLQQKQAVEQLSKEIDKVYSTVKRNDQDIISKAKGIAIALSGDTYGHLGFLTAISSSEYSSKSGQRNDKRRILRLMYIVRLAIAIATGPLHKATKEVLKNGIIVDGDTVTADAHNPLDPQKTDVASILPILMTLNQSLNLMYFRSDSNTIHVKPDEEVTLYFDFKTMDQHSEHANRICMEEGYLQPHGTSVILGIGTGILSDIMFYNADKEQEVNESLIHRGPAVGLKYICPNDTTRFNTLHDLVELNGMSVFIDVDALISPADRAKFGEIMSKKGSIEGNDVILVILAPSRNNEDDILKKIKIFMTDLSAAVARSTFFSYYAVSARATKPTPSGTDADFPSVSCQPLARPGSMPSGSRTTTLFNGITSTVCGRFDKVLKFREHGDDIIVTTRKKDCNEVYERFKARSTSLGHVIKAKNPEGGCMVDFLRNYCMGMIVKGRAMVLATEDAGTRFGPLELPSMLEKCHKMGMRSMSDWAVYALTSIAAALGCTTTTRGYSYTNPEEITHLGVHGGGISGVAPYTCHPCAEKLFYGANITLKIPQLNSSSTKTKNLANTMLFNGASNIVVKKRGSVKSFSVDEQVGATSTFLLNSTLLQRSINTIKEIGTGPMSEKIYTMRKSYLNSIRCRASSVIASVLNDSELAEGLGEIARNSKMELVGCDYLTSTTNSTLLTYVTDETSSRLRDVNEAWIVKSNIDGNIDGRINPNLPKDIYNFHSPAEIVAPGVYLDEREVENLAPNVRSPLEFTIGKFNMRYTEHQIGDRIIKIQLENTNNDILLPHGAITLNCNGKMLHDLPICNGSSSTLCRLLQLIFGRGTLPEIYKYRPLSSVIGHLNPSELIGVINDFKNNGYTCQQCADFLGMTASGYDKDLHTIGDNSSGKFTQLYNMSSTELSHVLTMDQFYERVKLSRAGGYQDITGSGVIHNELFSSICDTTGYELIFIRDVVIFHATLWGLLISKHFKESTPFSFTPTAIELPLYKLTVSQATD